MEKVYYNNLWKVRSAIDKLAQGAGVSKEKAGAFLRRQKNWQVYLAPPAHVPRPHWTVDQPNKVHQADLLFLPHDTVGRKVYKYALVVVDVASRYKDIKRNSRDLRPVSVYGRCPLVGVDCILIQPLLYVRVYTGKRNFDEKKV